MRKRLLFFFFLLFYFHIVEAERINQIIFFGDSLTDNGNLYYAFLKILPKSPPYFEGRFSNGYTWAEDVGKYFYQKNYIDYQNYAVGGATTISHLLNEKFFSPTTLGLELNSYLISTLFQDKTKVLYSIWIGANDYIFDQTSDPDLETQAVVDKIIWAVKLLASNGAKNFLIFNLPDLSKTPYAQENGLVEKLHLLTQLHNQKLATIINELRVTQPELKIVFFDIYTMFNDMIEDPEKYNKKYHVHITNTTQACWQGDVLLKNKVLDGLLNNDWQKNLKLKNKISLTVLKDFVSDSPAIAYVYLLGKSYEQGLMPCDNAEEYIFWDFIHPTETAHIVLSKAVIEALEQAFV